MSFQNCRGGRIVFQDIQKPTRDEWGSALDSLQASLELEKNVNKSLLDLHAVGARHKDENMCDFIEGIKHSLWHKGGWMGGGVTNSVFNKKKLSLFVIR